MVHGIHITIQLISVYEHVSGVSAERSVSASRCEWEGSGEYRLHIVC